MNFTGTRKSTFAELALTHLYTEATRNTEDPSDDTELAYHTLEEALDELERLKRYPTVDEVCEALSVQLKTSIKIGKNKHGITFNYVNTGRTFISLNYNLINITIQLPPHLITMIGRFYEGVNHEYRKLKENV